MSARALTVAFGQRPLGDDHDNDADNDAWNLSKVIYDQNGYVVRDSGRRVSRQCDKRGRFHQFGDGGFRSEVGESPNGREMAFG